MTMTTVSTPVHRTLTGRGESQLTKGRVEENEGQSTELLLEERNDGANLCLSSHY